MSEKDKSGLGNWFAFLLLALIFVMYSWLNCREQLRLAKWDIEDYRIRLSKYEDTATIDRIIDSLHLEYAKNSEDE